MQKQIWGNKFIYVRRRRKKEVLFFRDWIRGGIVFINDLAFRDGMLDCAAMYDLIDNKRNLFIELNLMRTALLPYRQEIRQQMLTNPHNFRQETRTKLLTTKQFYSIYLENKCSYIAAMSQQLDMFKDEDVSNEDIFRVKLVNIKELKLREFNFKVIYNILPCNVNLKRWGKKDYDVCDVCQESQTVKHLLFDCQYVKPLWKVIESVLDRNITFSHILCGFKCLYSNYLSSVCAFTIYKEWLLHSLENKNRPNTCNLDFFLNEISFRFEIYKKANLKYD